MIWERDPGPLHAKRAIFFRFRLEDADGRPAHNVELYMGMPGHAAFVRSDRSVFAHVHPSGSVPMASLSLTQNSAGASMAEYGRHGGDGRDGPFRYDACAAARSIFSRTASPSPATIAFTCR